MSAHVPPAAVLWDMDGTLIDTEPYWIAAETALAARFCVQWTHADGLGMVGNPLSVSAQALIDRGVQMQRDEVISELLDSVTSAVRAHVPWQPDARDLLEAVTAAGIPCALVTMSYGSLAEAFLEDAPGVFSAVVTGDQVARGKPDPESYLTAADLLGVDIERCIAIEDSPAGTRSAHASRAATIAVHRLTPLEPLPGMSRLRSLAGLDVDALAAILAGDVRDELA